ncbi:MAG: hypothetical protein ACE5HI_07450 [bacterium]
MKKFVISLCCVLFTFQTHAVDRTLTAYESNFVQNSSRTAAKLGGYNAVEMFGDTKGMMIRFIDDDEISKLTGFCSKAMPPASMASVPGLLKQMKCSPQGTFVAGHYIGDKNENNLEYIIPTIFLSDSLLGLMKLPYYKIYAAGLIIHEFVHFYQWKSGSHMNVGTDKMKDEAMCMERRAIETEAYDIQNKFLELNRVPSFRNGISSILPKCSV